MNDCIKSLLLWLFVAQHLEFGAAVLLTTGRIVLAIGAPKRYYGLGNVNRYDTQTDSNGPV